MPAHFSRSSSRMREAATDLKTTSDHDSPHTAIRHVAVVMPKSYIRGEITMSKYAVVDPATGELVEEYPTATDEQVFEALSSADFAYREWGRTSAPSDRASLLREVGRLHRERRDDLAGRMQREMGKDINQALGEVDFSASIYEFYADNAE